MSNKNTPTILPGDPGMRWYKALTYAVLFLIAAFFVSEGLYYSSGNIYISSGLTWEQVNGYYDAHAGLKTLDVAYGVACILVAVALMLTRHFLVKFHHLAPMMLLIVPLVGAACSIGYSFAAYATIGSSLTEALPFAATMFVLVTAFTVGNRIYFKKRDDMFYT